MLTLVDFNAVTMLSRCYAQLCVQVAEHRPYLRPMLDFLALHKTGHWKQEVRELAALALKNLTPLDLDYSKKTVSDAF